MIKTPLKHLAVLLLVGGMLACDEEEGLLQPEIGNTTDSFQFQATDVRDATVSVTYVWQNTGTVANVNHSTTTSAGSARLIVRAGNGAVVYDEQLVPSLNEPTASGTPGAWTVQLVLADYTGTLNFRLEKP